MQIVEIWAKIEFMKGKDGNLIMTLEEGGTVYLDGPGQIIIKRVRASKKATILIKADKETSIKWQSKDVANEEKKSGADSNGPDCP